MLYIVLFLHQTTTVSNISIVYFCCISYYSYIKPQLWIIWPFEWLCCISYYSYIKPQLAICLHGFSLVVYRTIPTSNHNFRLMGIRDDVVVYRTIPTSNHNRTLSAPVFPELYIVLFLHQTTTIQTMNLIKHSCISYYSYIKPQRAMVFCQILNVVYRTIPTSNHNCPLLCYS